MASIISGIGNIERVNLQLTLWQWALEFSLLSYPGHLHWLKNWARCILQWSARVMAARGHGEESESSDDCGSFVKSLISLFPDSEPETEPILVLNGSCYVLTPMWIAHLPLACSLQGYPGVIHDNLAGSDWGMAVMPMPLKSSRLLLFDEKKRGKCEIEYKQSGNTNFACLKLRFSSSTVVDTLEWFYRNSLGYDVTNSLNRTWNLGLSRDWRFLGPNHIGNLMGVQGDRIWDMGESTK